MENLKNKDFIRASFSSIRKNLSKERRRTASREAHEFCKSLKGPILSFASFGTEIDIWSMNYELLTKNALYLPRISEKDLEVHLVKNFHDLLKNKRGFWEPDPIKCPIFPKTTIQTTLVPGLAFDSKNHRVGYGGGFYDRFLENASCLKIGIGFHEQKVCSLPKESHDCYLNEVHLF